MVGVSSGARMAGRGAQMAGSVSNMGRTISAKGMAMKMGAESDFHAGKGNLYSQFARKATGRNMMRAGQYVENNPNRAMGIAAGVTGAGAYGVSRRRGSQNYPIQ